jgi:cytochrome P450
MNRGEGQGTEGPPSVEQGAAVLPFSVPGPPASRLLGPLGNVFDFVRDPLGHAGRLFAEHGPIVCLARGRSTWLVSTQADPPGTVFLYGAELNRKLFSQHASYDKSALTGPLHPQGTPSVRQRPLLHMLGGLFAFNGDDHRTQRRLLMPAFHKSRVDDYRDDMVAVAQAVLDGFRVGELRDVRSDMNELTLRIATRTLFGSDLGARGVAVGRKLQGWLNLFKLAATLPLDVPGLPYRRWLDLTHAIDDDMRGIIADKRRDPGDGRDILSALLAATDEHGAPLDDDTLLGHTSVLFAAGHETSANALCWTLVLLSQHPELAAALHEELSGELRGDAPRVEQLARLPLLDGVVKESLRLLPPVPLNHRIAALDTELGGHGIPRGTELISSAYHTQRVPEVYAEPRRFLPERWQKLDPGPYAYCPFGAGPRMCIGATFAVMEIKLVLAILLQRFRPVLPRGTRVDTSLTITMRPASRLSMLVCPVDGSPARSPRGIRGRLSRMVDFPAAG